MSAFFRLDRVRRTFGGLVAVNDLSFEIEAGSIVALIGPNGAGKSTVFNLITGIYPPTSGRIELEGRSLAGLRTDRITAGGIARTFQNIRLFAFMSALDNVMTGRHPRMHASMFDSLLHTPRQRAEERRVRERSRELLRFVGLERDAGDYARNLPYGSQRRLEIARALASEPKLLLLDEPGAGMNPREKDDLTGLIGRIRAQGVTVFLIEHDMNLVMALSERITVLDHGEKIAEGEPAAIRTDERVIEAYLGRPEEPRLMALLEVEAVDAHYGRIRALEAVTLHVDEGEIVTLIGANGAGKTTTLRAISGLLRATSGTISFAGERISRATPDEIVRRGIGHSPEGRRVFARMTVRENLELGAYTRSSSREFAEDLARVLETFPRLRERIAQKSGTLSGGEQQMLAIGRALMSRPRLLMLDEPSLGLSPILVQTIFKVIREINARGTTVLLIEQNARQALGIASRGYVLEVGRIVSEDTAANLMRSPAVQAAYLGGG